MQVMARDASAGEDAHRTAGLHPIEHKSLAGDPGLETSATEGALVSCVVASRRIMDDYYHAVPAGRPWDYYCSV
jgi:hypothetical protein